MVSHESGCCAGSVYKLISDFNALSHCLTFTGRIYASTSAIAQAIELKAPVITWPPSLYICLIIFVMVGPTVCIHIAEA